MAVAKTPFNWVGNKFKFLNEINSIVHGKQYNRIIDLFMGSGNLLLNISAEATTYIGNDKIKLLPYIYNELARKQYRYSLEDVENILNRFDRFSTKESYYTFRDYWNEKYLNNKFDRLFIVETILLLKMCSNSMVRFNPKQGYFNQGFRGLGKKSEFFTETMKQSCVNELNNVGELLATKNFKFANKDFLEFTDSTGDTQKDLLIIDPPYMLQKDMYTMDWTAEHDTKLFDLLSNTKNDFIYFNYLVRDGVVNEELKQFIEDNKLTYKVINSKTLSGQGRSENIREVQEVIVTNVQV